MKAAILVLIGIPAVGKTTLTQHLKGNPSLSKYAFIHVCYDDLIPLSSFEIPSQWKGDRQKIFNQVHSLVKSFTESNEMECPCIWKSIWGETIKSLKPIIIIIDDNMYYRSMRYIYYRLAKEYSLSFCEVYLEATLELVKKINAMRPNNACVPQEVVENIYRNLEPPNLRNNWENHHIVVPAYTNVSLICERVEGLLQLSLSNPEKPSSKNADSSYHPVSVIHLIDNKIRRAVSRKMQERKSKLDGKDLKKFGEELVKKKGQILLDLKRGFVMLPNDLNENSRDEYFDQFVNALLDS